MLKRSMIRCARWLASSVGKKLWRSSFFLPRLEGLKIQPMMTFHTHFTNEQKQMIQALSPLGVGGLNATHGLVQDFKCAYCDIDYIASFDAYHSLTLDHIIPQSRGGVHSEENTVACCRACNVIKATYYPDGKNRDERIANVRDHLKQKREQKEAEVAKLRLFIRGGSPQSDSRSAP